MKHNIIFTPIDPATEDLLEPPQPSIRANIPSWYKKAPKYNHGEKSIKYTEYGNNLTVKSCMPMVDSFTSGYIHSTPCDIQVIRGDNGINLRWSHDLGGLLPPVAVRPKEFENSFFPKIEGYDDLSFNWTTYWNIKTPKGYSCLFTHPLNRPDLPFYSFSAVIDTDSWNIAGFHPFLIKENWEGIIPKGTPMFQVIPFKRDSWKSKKEKLSTNDKKLIFEKASKISNYYKHNLWSKKDYK